MIRLDQATQENAGAKAAVLGKLATAGFPVPPGFVIPVDAYRAFTHHLNLADVLSQQGPAEVRRLIETQPLPPELVNELTKALTELGDFPVAVRSSATTEDTADASAAGQHDTYLGVHGTTAVADRVKACWSSLWSNRATTYRQSHPPSHDRPQHPNHSHTRNPDHTHEPDPAHAHDPAHEPDHIRDPAIAVIIQRHVDAETAGVLFTTAEASIIEASWGLGESVVQGLVTPDAFTVTPAGPTDHRLGSKQTRIDRDPTGATITTQVAPRERERLCLTDSQLRQLNQLGQAVTTHLGPPQDIEFALDPTGLWLLQSRPITAPLPLGSYPAVEVPSEVGKAGAATDEVPGEAHGLAALVVWAEQVDPLGDRATAGWRSLQSQAHDGQSERDHTEQGSRHRWRPPHPLPALALGSAVKVLRGVGGSAGAVSGVARVVEGPGDFGRVGVGEILVCRFTDPGWTPLFGIVAGVVTETGGRLSHAAIVAREHRIPAVLGVSELMTTVRDGQRITIDGSAGSVELTP